MTKPSRRDLTIAAVALIVGAAGAYGLMPKKVEIKEKIVQVKVSDTERTRDRDVVRVREKRPDGTEVVRTEIKDRTTESSQTEERSESEKSKVVERGSGLAVYGLVKGPLGAPEYGAMVSKKLLGPLSLGAFGFTDRTYGLSIGLEF
jgi:hypothetical protein